MVVRWQRQRFRSYWAELSKKRGKLDRPAIGKVIRELFQTMARANRLWRAPRIHGELLKLGIEVSERTEFRILQTVDWPPSQTRKTFLQNHVREIVAVDFFTVPTIHLRILFVFLVLEHQRRKVLHFGVTEHPSAEWAATRCWGIIWHTTPVADAPGFGAGRPGGPGDHAAGRDHRCSSGGRVAPPQ